MVFRLFIFIAVLICTRFRESVFPKTSFTKKDLWHNRSFKRGKRK
ncbi:hypothetical protein JCM19294_869 [Nonlabens tegetincola]|uniref:Uncharacterized protein n=1 Tax=Nonlabens tegetincola TaxID=323273 RepID=A0A090Q5E7_9FLAO|nr:hypothetical protein JCM19294_869 [Nonlabens tegetincola]